MFETLIYLQRSNDCQWSVLKGCWSIVSVALASLFFTKVRQQIMFMSADQGAAIHKCMYKCIFPPVLFQMVTFALLLPQFIQTYHIIFYWSCR